MELVDDELSGTTIFVVEDAELVLFSIQELFITFCGSVLVEVVVDAELSALSNAVLESFAGVVF